MCGGSPSIGHRLTNLLESGLNCLKTGLLTPGPSKLCSEVSLYLLRVLPSPGVRSLPLSDRGGTTTPSGCCPFIGPGGPGYWAYSPGCQRKQCDEEPHGVRETERPLQTVEGWLASAVSTLLVSSHSGQMSDWYGFVYVKFPFCLWAGWDLVLSRGVFLAKVPRCHPCLLTAQLWSVWAEKILLYLRWELQPCGASWAWGQCP